MNSINLIACILILGNVSLIYGNIVCSPGDDLLPNPFCCTSFYQCANGVPILFHCAANHQGEDPLVFNPNLKQCVYSSEYPCRITVDKPPTPPPAEPDTTPIPAEPDTTPIPAEPDTTPIPAEPDTTPIPAEPDTTPIPAEPDTTPIPAEPDTTPIPAEPDTTPIPTEPDTTPIPAEPDTTPIPAEPDTTPTPPTTPSPGDPFCSPGDDLLPNHDDCSSFYQCANGVPILFQCAANLEGEPPLNFDPVSKVCVYPHEYPCQCHKQNSFKNCLDTKLNSTSNCAYCFDCCFSDGESPACDSYENLRAAGCKHFSYDDVLEIKPGCNTCEPEVELNRTKTISVTFNIDKHPLDLYYLMDVSGSMHDDRDNLVLLSSGLIDTLKSLTPDFHIGYGSFIDKPRAPFGNAARNDYSFRNNLPLTNQTDRFMNSVRDTVVPLPDAYDVPESHGDALSQVIACDAIGWRKTTRRVVLLATDATFHTAGDGALGNIFEPYKDGCYLDSNGYYTQQLTMDYPSVQQLATAYSKQQSTVIVIFATNTSTIGFYEQVASQFSYAHVAILNTDSSNILDIVRSEYSKIQSRMEIENSEANDAVKFTYFSNCARNDSEIETIFCENLPPSGEVTFKVKIDLAKCPDDPNNVGTKFILNPVGLPTFVAVELAFLC